MGAATVAVTDTNWETEIEKHTGHALVDFWATWCGPCRMIAPSVDELATEFAGKLKVAKVDVDNNTDVASKYGIRSIPCLILFKDGQEIDRVVGAQSKAQLKTWITEKVK